MKKLLGIIIMLIMFGSIGGLIWWDISHKLTPISSECTHENCTNSHRLGYVCSHGHHHDSSWSVVAHELIHYVIHIFVCLFFCVFFHKPFHKFWNWVKSLLGYPNKDEDCKADCKH